LFHDSRDPAPENAMNAAGRIQEAACRHVGHLVKSVCFVVVFSLSIGGAAGCPKDAGEEDHSDNGYHKERGSDHD
jgi:hypothetical protein